MPDLLALIAQIGNEKAAKKVMPWAMAGSASASKATVDEIAAAQAELDEGFTVAGA